MRCSTLAARRRVPSRRASAAAKRDGKVAFQSLRPVKNKAGETVVLNRNGEVLLVDGKGREIDRYTILTGATLHVAEDDKIKAGDVICTWDPHHVPITRSPEAIRYEDLHEGRTLKIERDARRKAARRQVIEYKVSCTRSSCSRTRTAPCRPTRSRRRPTSRSRTARRSSPASSWRSRRAKRRVRRTSPVVCRVTELFEARRPKDPAVMAEIDGVGDRKRGKRTVIRALGAKGEVIEEVEHAVPQGKHLRVHKGDEVRAGELLPTGRSTPTTSCGSSARSPSRTTSARSRTSTARSR